MTELKLHLSQIRVVLISAVFDHHDILKVRKKYVVKAVCIGTTLKNPGKKKKNRWTLL